MADLTRVAEVLAAHALRWKITARNTTRLACRCGGWEQSDNATDDSEASFAAHQAQMLADAGLVASGTEWGHVADGYLVEEGASEEGARRGGADDDHHFPSLGTWPARVVRREVTPWRPADEGGEA